MSMRTLAVVPARGGSVRVKRKNLYLLGGKTLVRRALETTLATTCFERMVLSSDDEEILAEGADLDEVVALRRPPELATATATSFDVVVHALDAIEATGAGPFDAIAVIQCTSPFTAPEDIEGAVALLERSGAGSVASVVKLEGYQHPIKFKLMDGDRLIPYLEDDRLMPAHELPELWVRNGSVYVCRRETLASGALLSDDVHGYAMPRERSHDIDTPTDLAFAEFLLERGGRGDPALAPGTDPRNLTPSSGEGL